jgi:mono/diheme cytochrome c family protein
MKSHKTTKFSKKISLAIIGLFSVSLIACSSDSGKKQSTSIEKAPPAEEIEANEAGIGPVSAIELDDTIDEVLAETGKEIFNSKCTACHKLDQRMVGPALGGITEKRNPAWIMNMILNPQEMTQKDPIAKQLLAEYRTQMIYQDITQDQSRAILEYFRLVDSN